MYGSSEISRRRCERFVLCFYLPLQLHRSPLEPWCAAAIGVPPHVLHVKFWPSWQTVAPKFEKCWTRVVTEFCVCYQALMTFLH